MGFRFFRRKKILPGITLNLSRSGPSLSFGPCGAKYTVGSKGRRTTFGIPGTGLFYTQQSKSSSSKKPVKEQEVMYGRGAEQAGSDEPLTLGFFRRLITPDNEKALVDGFREMSQGKENKAAQHLSKASDIPDGAFLRGFLSLKKKRYKDAIRFLSLAASGEKDLNRHFSKYGITAAVTLPVTNEISITIGPDFQGAMLALAEAYQAAGNLPKALQCVNNILGRHSQDLIALLSSVEIIMDLDTEETKKYKGVVEATQLITNETAIHTALLMYRARALRKLGLLDAARDTATKTLRRTKNRPEELMLSLRYERAMIYEHLGHKKRARKDLEKIYARDTGFEDVEERLGV